MELLDPPFELVESLCPSCAVLDERREELRREKQGRPGLQMGFRRIESKDDELDD